MWTPLRLCSNFLSFFLILCDLPSIYGNDDDVMVIIPGYTKHSVVLGFSVFWLFLVHNHKVKTSCSDHWIHVWENLISWGNGLRMNMFTKYLPQGKVTQMWKTTICRSCSWKTMEKQRFPQENDQQMDTQEGMFQHCLALGGEHAHIFTIDRVLVMI